MRRSDSLYGSFGCFPQVKEIVPYRVKELSERVEKTI